MTGSPESVADFTGIGKTLSQINNLNIWARQMPACHQMVKEAEFGNFSIWNKLQIKSLFKKTKTKHLAIWFSDFWDLK